MKLASVILDIPTQALDVPYTYRVPDQQGGDDYPVCVGCAVVVPLGGRKAIGFVVELFDGDSDSFNGGTGCIYDIDKSLKSASVGKKVIDDKYMILGGEVLS